jgi:Zn-dependent protease
MQEFLVLGVAWYVIFLFTTVLHEAAHSVIAQRLGDRTGHEGGFATLDPLPHLRRSPVGMIAVPLVTLVMNQGHWMIGWASVPYDPQWALRRPRHSALMAAAGPATNLALALVAFLVLRAGLAAEIFTPPARLDLTHLVEAGEGNRLAAGAGLVFSIMLSLNLILAVFNLMPVPPLDGSGLPPFLLSDSAARRYMRVMWSPEYQFPGLIVAWLLFDYLWPSIYRLLLAALHPGIAYG